MADEPILLSHAEVVTAILKAKGIHEGRWALSVNFGFGASNIGPDPTALNPTAVVSVFGLGIRSSNEPDNNLTVDAAVVNPRGS